jgi:hypothetical protein
VRCLGTGLPSTTFTIGHEALKMNVVRSAGAILYT